MVAFDPGNKTLKLTPLNVHAAIHQLVPGEIGRFREPAASKESCLVRYDDWREIARCSAADDAPDIAHFWKAVFCIGQCDKGSSRVVSNHHPMIAWVAEGGDDTS